MTSRMEVFPYELDKEKLNVMPENERTLLFLLGHATNEINVLQKLLIMTVGGRPEGSFVDHVEAAQAMIIMRILIGKLHEAWSLLQTRYFKSTVAKEYSALIDNEGRVALKYLKKHFANSPLSQLRNSVCFHYPQSREIQRAYEALPNEIWRFYLAQHSANTFYLASETAVNYLLASELGGDPGRSGLKALFDAVITVARQLAAFFGKLIVLICEKWLSGTEVTPVKLTVPQLSYVPFFIDPTSLKRQPAHARTRHSRSSAR